MPCVKINVCAVGTKTRGIVNNLLILKATIRNEALQVSSQYNYIPVTLNTQENTIKTCHTSCAATKKIYK